MSINQFFVVNVFHATAVDTAIRDEHNVICRE